MTTSSLWLLTLIALLAVILVLDLGLALLQWRVRGWRWVIAPYGKVAFLNPEDLEVRRERIRSFVEELNNEKWAETEEGFRPLFRISKAESAAQLATFQWQAKSELRLRLARVADTVSVFAANRNGGARRGEDAYSEFRPRPAALQISLQSTRLPLLLRLWMYMLYGRLPQTSSMPQLSRFNRIPRRAPCVIVQSFEERKLGPRLAELWRWLGVAIAFEPISAPDEFGHCRASEDEGQVGGHLQWPGSSPHFGLTASHVLGLDCGSRVFASDITRAYTLEPDVALINLDSPCLFAEIGGRTVTAVDEDWGKQAAGRAVQLMPSGRIGKLETVCLWATYSGRTHDFPHALLTRNAFQFMGVSLPWGLNFSRPGDSGSWVMDRDENSWIGVLVGGDLRRHISYAALAQPVVTYLTRTQGFNSQVSCFAA